MLNQHEKRKSFLSSFYKLSENLAVTVNDMAALVAKLEQSYSEINTALPSIPTSDGCYSITSLGLMDRVLEPETYHLLLSIARVKQALASTVGLLIITVDDTLSQVNNNFCPSVEDDAEVSQLKTALIESLTGLKEIRSQIISQEFR